MKLFIFYWRLCFLLLGRSYLVQAGEGKTGHNYKVLVHICFKPLSHRQGGKCCHILLLGTKSCRQDVTF